MASTNRPSSAGWPSAWRRPRQDPGSMPRASSSMRALVATPARRTWVCSSRASTAECAFNCSRKADPTRPAPTRYTSIVRRSGNSRAPWIALSARTSLARLVAMEMLRSEVPPANVWTGMPCAASTPNRRPTAPGRTRMPSPTAAMSDTSSSTTSSSMRPNCRSSRNSSSTRARARVTAPGATAKAMECSLDACEIRITLMPSRASAPNSRMAMPGTPTMPSPCRRSSATRLIELIPQMS